MFNNAHNYSYIIDPYKTYYNNFINNATNSAEYLEKTQTNFLNIFSPSIININILELLSLKKKVNYNSQYRVNSKKLTKSSNKEKITLNSRKKILVLDLDETLVHASKIFPFPNKKNIILNMYMKNIKYQIYVIIRPFFEKFLHEMSLYYDLYIFTASIPQYSKPLINIIDKNKVIIQVLTRENCLNIKGNFVKDLSIFNKDLKDIIIIDNNPAFYALNKDNGIPIPTWIDEPNDKELLKLIPILKYLSEVKDVRPIIKKIINSSQDKVDFSKVNEILKKENKLKYIRTHNNIKRINNLNKFNNISKSFCTIKIDQTNDNKKRNNSIKSGTYKANKMKNTKHYSDFNESIIKKLNIHKKLKINKTKIFSINSTRNPIYNIKLSQSGIIKKINVTDTSISPKESEIINKNTFRKNLANKKCNISKIRINLNKVENKNDKNKNNSNKKEETIKYPNEKVKKNIKRNLILPIKNKSDFKTIQTEIGNKRNKNNFIAITEKGNENSHLKSISKINIVYDYTKIINQGEQLSRLVIKTNQPTKKNKIKFMKILKKPNESKENVKLFNKSSDGLI